jgi:DNA-binding response OmpR family regulator
MLSDPVFLRVENRRPDGRAGLGLAKVEGPAAKVPQRTSPSRILIVEDEMLIQMLAVEILKELGFNVDTAGSAADARSKLRLLEGDVDAVILDIGLPDAKGDLLLKEIRGAYPALPILITSGQDDAELRTQFAGLEFVEFLSKPYVLEQVRSALASVGAIAVAR